MSITVAEKRMQDYLRDRQLLPYDDKTIAEKLKMSRPNFSAYVTGRYPITKAFLSKFYNAFEGELAAIRQKQSSLTDDLTDFDDLSLSKRVDLLNKLYGGLQTSFDGLRTHMDNLDVRVNRILQSTERLENFLLQRGALPSEEKKAQI